MNRNLIGTLVLLVVAGIAYWAVTSNTGDTVAEEEDLPELPSVVEEDIARIELQRVLEGDTEPTTMVLERADEENFNLVEPLAARGARSPVNDIVRRVTSLELRGIAARNATHHEQLQVAGDDAVRVTAKNAGGEVLVDFWVGRVQTPNTLIRLEGDDTVLMVDGSIRYAFAKAPNDLRDRRLTTMAATDIQAVDFVGPNGTFRFAQGDDGWAQVLAPLAEDGEELSAIEDMDAERVGGHIRSLARVSATSFPETEMDASAAGLGPDAPTVTFTYLGDAEGEAEEGEEPPPRPTQTMALRIGDEVSETTHERYAQISGEDTIYIVSRFLSEKLLPEVASFQPAPEVEEEEAPPEALPPGIQGQNLPPGAAEALRQLQESGQLTPR